MTYFSNETVPPPGNKFIPMAGPARRFSAILLDWFCFMFLFFAMPEPLKTLVYFGFLANTVVLQGMTGQSIGKRMAGISLAYIPQRIGETAWTPLIPGVGRCALRLVLHFIDTIFFVGFFRMLFNPFSQSFADSLAHTVVIYEHGTKLQRRDEWLRRQ